VDDTPAFRPPALDAIMAEAAACGFCMSCEERTGSLLAVLAAPMAWASGLLLGSRTRPAAREPPQRADVARPPG